MDDSCIHPECNRVRNVAAMLFDGVPLRMVDISEDTPGALPYGSECSRLPNAHFQVQDPQSGEWFQVTFWQIRDPRTKEDLNNFAARIGAERDATAPPAPEEELQDALDAD